MGLRRTSPTSAMPASADGLTPCPLCGEAVPVGDDGRCDLGHRVHAPRGLGGVGVDAPAAEAEAPSNEASQSSSESSSTMTLRKADASASHATSAPSFADGEIEETDELAEDLTADLSADVVEDLNDDLAEALAESLAVEPQPEDDRLVELDGDDDENTGLGSELDW